MQVLEYTLRVTGDALLSGDFDAFASIFDLPHHISTFEGSRTLRTQDDLRHTFDAVHMHCVHHQVTSVVRECISAEFDEHGQIKSAHTTRLLVGAQQLGQTSMAYGVLRLKGARWLTTASQYAVPDKKFSQTMIISSNRPVNTNADPLRQSKGPAET